MSSQGLLPTIGRIVDELDGSYHSGRAWNLYDLTTEYMNWSRGTQHTPTATGESFTYYSPWSEGKTSVRGEFRIYFEKDDPRRGVPCHTKYEVEIWETPKSSLLITSETDRVKSGAIIQLHRKIGACVFPLWGDPDPWKLDGDLSKEIETRKHYIRSFFRPGDTNEFINLSDFTTVQDGLVYLTHMGLVVASQGRRVVMGQMPTLRNLAEPLEKMIRVSHARTAPA